MRMDEAGAGTDAAIIFQRQGGFAIGAFRHQATDDPLASAAAGAMISFPHMIVNDVTP